MSQFKKCSKSQVIMHCVLVFVFNTLGFCRVCPPCSPSPPPQYHSLCNCGVSDAALLKNVLLLPLEFSPKPLIALCKFWCFFDLITRYQQNVSDNIQEDILISFELNKEDFPAHKLKWKQYEYLTRVAWGQVMTTMLWPLSIVKTLLIVRSVVEGFGNIKIGGKCTS